MNRFTLSKLANKRDHLNERIQVQCLVDGFEVLSVKNYAQVKFETAHPCLTRLSKKDLMSYLEESGVLHWIEEEVDRIQEQIMEEWKRVERDPTTPRKLEPKKAAAQ